MRFPLTYYMNIDFVPGETYQALIGGGIYKIYILNIIDDKYVVYKWYGRYKQWWHYNITHMYTLEGYVELAKKRSDQDGR